MLHTSLQFTRSRFLPKREVITLQSQVSDQTGLAAAVRPINDLAIAQVRKNTSIFDVKGLGRPEETDFPQWSKKEVFFAGADQGVRDDAGVVS